MSGGNFHQPIQSTQFKLYEMSSLISQNQFEQPVNYVK